MTVSDFDKNLNISYIDENLEKPSTKLILKHYFCSVLIYFFIYIIFCFNPLFIEKVTSYMRHAYEIGLFAYILIAPIAFLIFKPKSIHNSHSIHVINYFTKVFKQLFLEKKFKDENCKNVLGAFIPTYQEKQALMLFFIKVFFGSLMVRGVCQNTIVLNKDFDILFNTILKHQVPFDYHNVKELIIINHRFLFELFVLCLFTLDLAIFVFGYLTETAFFKNKIRTVDTNIVSIIFCLACYTPFNGVTSTFTGWNQSNESLFYDNGMTLFGWILRFISLFFMITYVWASVALGTKASNLTNRGIVCKFPYNIVRHPAYISKNTFWLLTTMPIFFVDFNNPNFVLESYLKNLILAIIAFCATAIVYYFRAICEEKHLMQDPDYQEYAKKVKYRFIPYVF